MSGVVMSQEFNKQVVEAVKSDRRRRGVKTVDTDYGASQQKMASRFPARCVIINAALPAASDSKTGATKCQATICRWAAEDEEYIETDPAEEIEVWNHSEETDYEIDTFGKAEFIDGHYWFFGDCGPMANREGS